MKIDLSGLITAADKLAQQKASKLTEINAAAQTDIAPYTGAYPRFEIDTWPQQEKEAAAFALDDTIETPFCTAAAVKRGITREAFIAKVQAKVAIYVQVSAAVTGYRQSLEDALNAIDLDDAEAADQIAAITYTSPLTQ